jgi:hypothetical protein
MVSDKLVHYESLTPASREYSDDGQKDPNKIITTWKSYELSVPWESKYFAAPWM